MQKKTEETGTREKSEKVAKCCVKHCRQHSRFLTPHSGRKIRKVKTGENL